MDGSRVTKKKKKYNGDWWIAFVDNLNSEARQVRVKFVHPHGPNTSFVFPEPQDMLIVDISDILTTVDTSTATGCAYTLDISIEENITFQQDFD